MEPHITVKRSHSSGGITTWSARLRTGSHGVGFYGKNANDALANLRKHVDTDAPVTFEDNKLYRIITCAEAGCRGCRSWHQEKV